MDSNAIIPVIIGLILGFVLIFSFTLYQKFWNGVRTPTNVHSFRNNKFQTMLILITGIILPLAMYSGGAYLNLAAVLFGGRTTLEIDWLGGAPSVFVVTVLLMMVYGIVSFLIYSFETEKTVIKYVDDANEGGVRLPMSFWDYFYYNSTDMTPRAYIKPHLKVLNWILRIVLGFMLMGVFALLYTIIKPTSLFSHGYKNLEDLEKKNK